MCRLFSSEDLPLQAAVSQILFHLLLTSLICPFQVYRAIAITQQLLFQSFISLTLREVESAPELRGAIDRDKARRFVRLSHGKESGYASLSMTESTVFR
jgi:hypothetical protein